MSFASLGVCALLAVQTDGFEPPVDHAVGADPADVAIGDLDADQAPEIAVVNRAADSLSLLWNDGAGGFPTRTTPALPAGCAPAAVGAGTLRAGARLAVGCGDSDALLHVDAAGIVTATVPAPAGAAVPADVAVGDLDGAGDEDVLVAYAGDAIGGGGGLAAVLDDGASPLASALLPAPPEGFQRLRRTCLLDADDDGDLDAAATVVPGLFGPSGVEGVLLYENDGAGGFAYAGRIATAEPPSGLAAGDLDADGHDDLAVAFDGAPLSAESSVVVHLHDGVGAVAPASFLPQAPSVAGALAVDLACADLGDDGLPGFLVDLDVAAANFGSADLGLHATFEPGGGAFAEAATTAAGLGPAAIAVGDLDGDRTPDLVVVDRPADRVQVLLSIPFALAQTFGAGCPGTAGTTPAIDAVGLPIYDEPAFGVRLSDARPLAPALLGVSGMQATTALVGGCALYVPPPVAVLPAATDAAGEATVELAIPSDVAPFSGLNLFFQYLVFDPFGTYLGAYALSDGLRIKLGDPPPGS